MTTVCDHIIEEPGAWTASDIGGKEKFVLNLEKPHLEALDTLLKRTRHLAPQQVTRADFDHPAIKSLTDNIRENIMNGLGVVIVRGVSPQRYTEEEFQRIYWGIGTYLGHAAIQSALGDRLGYVQNNKDDPVGRSYRSLQELTPHTDSYEIVGLMCVRAARSGGFSGMVSSLAIHNAILRSRPELLAPLYRGYFYASDDAKTTAKPVTDERLSIYSYVGGKVSCNISRKFITRAAEVRKEPLPADLAEAIDYMMELAVRPDLALSFLLEPGEMMLWHNFMHLHSRTSFEDAPESPRLLFRMWLSVPDGRPRDPSFSIRANTYDRIYSELHT